MSSPRLQIQLPHKANGETDWKTLGNMLAAHILGEVLQASYVDYKYGCKTSGFEAATDWEFFYEEHEVMVFRKRFSDSPIHAWLGRCVVDLPPKDVATFIDNLETRKYWDKYLSEIRVQRQISDVDFIFYLHLVATQCLVKQHRDFTYYERISFVEGKYVRSCLSVDIPEYPSVRGITRAQMLPGTGWVLEPYENNKTLVNFLAHTDLKNLPPLIINRATRRSPMTVYHIREFLTNPVYRSKYEKVPPERTTDTFTDSDLAYLNEQNVQQDNLQASSTHLYRRRFLAEEQLSVRDFLRNRPSLRRNFSEPFNLSSSCLDSSPLKQQYKQRSHSQGESMAVDVEDCDSSPKAVHYCAVDSSNGLYSEDSSIEWNPKSHNTLETQNADYEVNQEITTQTNLSESTQEVAQREIGTNTPYLTPQTSEDESSSFVSPLNSPDNLSLADEDTHTMSLNIMNHDEDLERISKEK